MGMIDRLGRTMPDLWVTLGRFPIPVLISLVGTIVVNLDIAGVGSFYVDRSSPYWDEQVYGGLIAGFLASGAAHLYAEGRHWARLPGFLLAVLAGAAAGAICWFLHPLNLQFVFLFPGLVLAVMVAGFTGNGDDNGLWMFNLRLALAVILSALVTVVFGGGLSAIVESIRYLFGVDFDSDIHEHIWATGIALIGAIYGLSVVSRNLSEDFDPQRNSDLLVSGTLLLLKYLLVPLALVYVVILHLYAGKMLVEWELPKGQVGIMVLIFSLGGAAIWLIAYPWRGSGSVLLRFFSKNWFLFLIVPLCLLAIGTSRRISDYGVTPERYGLVALGFWVAFLIVWFVIRRRSIEPRIVLGSLCGLLLVTSFGPWGAGSVSIASQLSRLDGLMRAEGYFQNGGLVVPDTIDEKASGEAHSIVMFLSRNRRLDALAPMFSAADNDPFDGGEKNASANDVISVLKFTRWQGDRATGDLEFFVHFSASRPATLDIQQATVLSGVIEMPRADFTPEDSGGADPHLFVENDNLTIRYLGNRWQVPVSRLLETVRAAPRADTGYAALVTPLAGAAGEARLVLLSLNGRLNDDGGRIDYARAMVLLPASVSRLQGE
ncbi:MAG: DUF4153 domain-containing protein [Alphaproteobacteria bacterium]|nr:DUF4153 domain-containing protein [Alphaproteobacteria bacterium]